MAGIAPAPFSNHLKRVSCATLSTEHPQSSVLRFVGGGVSKEHYSSLQPHHWVTMLTCSSNNLSMLSGVFKRLRCVQRSDWRLAFRFLRESKLINVKKNCFVLFCLFFGAWQFCPRFATIKELELRPMLLSKPSKNVDKQIPE